MTKIELETQAWLASLPAENVQQAIAYTRGGYWILGLGALVTICACLILVRSNLFGIFGLNSESVEKRPNVRAFLIGAVFVLALSIMTLPFELYAEWHREISYNLSSQSFASWMEDWGIMLGLQVVLLSAFVTVFYIILRRSGQKWWIWASAITSVFLAVIVLILPVFIEPLFNTYKPAPEGDVRDAIVELAEETGAPADKIYIYDWSRQSERYTANVSGAFGFGRIALSDTMFKKGADLSEIRAVVAHEIAHYTYEHVTLTLLMYSALSFALFYLADKVFNWLSPRVWKSRAIPVSDPESLPLLYAILSALFLLTTPVTNTFTRTIENTADAYSLRIANEPDGLAKALLKTAEYRAPSPTGLEEVLFYTHPSVERRIRRAMIWKYHSEDAQTGTSE